MSVEQAYTISVAPALVSLAVVKSRAGVVVRSDVGGLLCPSACLAVGPGCEACRVTLRPGQVVTLTGIPDAGSLAADAWQGCGPVAADSCELLIEADATIRLDLPTFCELCMPSLSGWRSDIYR